MATNPQANAQQPQKIDTFCNKCGYYKALYKDYNYCPICGTHLQKNT